MPSPVYSQRFHSEHNVSGDHDFENLTGALMIFQTLTARSGDDGAAAWELWINGTTVARGYYFAGALVVGNPGSFLDTRCHICIPPGDAYRVHMAGAWDYSIHGYQLSLP